MLPDIIGTVRTVITVTTIRMAARTEAAAAADPAAVREFLQARVIATQ
jgi:hypothetical protein